MRRRFRIWQDSPQCWRWECTLCQPPAHGGRFGEEAWRKIVAISLPGHMRHRHFHHIWVKHHVPELQAERVHGAVDTSGEQSRRRHPVGN